MDSITGLLAVMTLAIVVYGWMLVDLNRRYAKMHRDLLETFGVVGQHIRKLEKALK